MTDLDDAFRTLQAEYLAEGPAHLATLREAAGLLQAGNPEAQASVVTGFHRLAGSGGSYGFPEISSVAREAEQWIRGQTVWSPEGYQRLERAIERVAQAFESARQTFEGTARGRGRGRGRGEGASSNLWWRAHMSGSDGAGALAEVLTSSGFQVSSNGRTGASDMSWRDPDDAPDLVVLLDGPDEKDLVGAAATWTRPLRSGPRAIVVVSDRVQADRARLTACGIDLVVRPETASAELARFATALAQIGHPPFRVLVVEHDLDQAQVIASALEAAHAVVRHETDPTAAAGVFAHTPIDLVLLDVTRGARESFAFARSIRSGPAVDVPIVCLAKPSLLASQLTDVRTTANHVLLKPIEAAQHSRVQGTLMLAERGRSGRVMIYRDGLTGLLNHGAFRSEFAHAVRSSRKDRRVSLILIDIDHFGRLNDAHGHAAGDRLLVHLAGVLHGAALGRHILGRTGADEFGLILDHPAPEDPARAVAALTALIASRPLLAAPGGALSIGVSVGVARFPDDASTASGLFAAASRALHRAKPAARGD